MTKPLLGLICSLFLIVSLSTMSITSGPAFAQPLQRLLIGTPDKTMVFLPLILGTNRGFFRQAGLDAKLVVMIPRLLVSAMMSGEIDYSSAIGTSVRSAVQGLPIKVVAVYLDRVLFYLMVRPEIKALQELRGKTIAVSSIGATTDFAARTILRNQGLNPDKDVTIVGVGPGTNRYAALKGGSVPASMLDPPDDVLARLDGFKELAFAGDLMPMPFTGLTMTDKKMKENPEQFERVMRVTARSLKYVREQREEVIKFIVAEWKLTPAVASGTYDSVLKAMSKTGDVPDEAMKLVIEEARERMKIQLAIPVNKVADFSGIKKAMREVQ